MSLGNYATGSASRLLAHPAVDASAVNTQISRCGFGATKSFNDRLSRFHFSSVAIFATTVNGVCSETRNGTDFGICDNRYMLTAWFQTALKSSGISQAEISRQLTSRLGRSIDRAAVNKMKSGERAIAGDELLALGEITGVSPPIDNTPVTLVPMLSWVSAGRMRDPGTPLPIQDVPLLAFSDLGRGDFFALKVAGDSMDRISPDGSTIIVNRAERSLQRGRLYVFSLRGETTYKAWEPEPVARLEPRSLNMAHHPIFVQSEEEFEVVGRVRRTMFDL